MDQNQAKATLEDISDYWNERSEGYDAQVAYNSSNQMYRVVAATFDAKQDAVRSRNDLRSQYPDAWILYNQK